MRCSTAIAVIAATARRVLAMGAELGIDWTATEFAPVEHHLAHASSAYHLSGFEERTAILGVDGKGEYATTFFGYGEDGRIHKIKEFYDPDSISGVYGALTEYLGFEMLDGEYKVMGMAPYGDPNRHDLSRLFRTPRRRSGGRYALREHRWICGATRRRRRLLLQPEARGLAGPASVRRHRSTNLTCDYAAALQRAVRRHVSANWCDVHLGDILADTGKLAFAGGGALNVKLNQRLDRARAT